jgi:hypothetical protein
MRKLALFPAVTIFLSLLPFASVAQDSQVKLNLDGTFWSLMSKTGPDSGFGTKLAYVTGYRSGYTLGFMTSMVLLQQRNKAVTDEDQQKLLNFAFRGAKASNGDVVKQVDLIYSDYRNTPVCVKNVIFDALVSLEGISVEKSVEDSRREDAGKCNTN